ICEATLLLLSTVSINRQFESLDCVILRVIPAVEPRRGREDLCLTKSFYVTCRHRIEQRYRLTCIGGMRSRQGVACSNALASRIRVASSPNLAINWAPTGKPALVCPRGREIAGWPVTLKTGRNMSVSCPSRVNATKSRSVRVSTYLLSGSGGCASVGVNRTSYPWKNCPKLRLNLFKKLSARIKSATLTSLAQRRYDNVTGSNVSSSSFLSNSPAIVSILTSKPNSRTTQRAWRNPS